MILTNKEQKETTPTIFENWATSCQTTTRRGSALSSLQVWA